MANLVKSYDYSKNQKQILIGMDSYYIHTNISGKRTGEESATYADFKTGYLKLQEINRERVSAEIEKALSDVKRDEVLMQYQFFVGEKDFRTALQREKNGENEGFRL